MTEATQTDLTDAQAMTLAAIAATAATPRPSGETLYVQTQRVVAGISILLTTPSLGMGLWRMAWLGLSPGNANMAYIAQNLDGSNQFAVVVRGTFAGSPIDMMEDLDVGTVVPFTAGGSPAPVAVSAGAMAAFTEVATMSGVILGPTAEQPPQGDPWPQDGSGPQEPGSIMGVTLTDALSRLVAAAPAAPRPTVHVTGHSLGGCVATMLAAYLKAQPWTAGDPQFCLITFAAPTAGLQSFASYVDSLKWSRYETYANAYDLVPRAWSDLAAADGWFPPPGPVATEKVKIMLSTVAGLTKGNAYVQPDAGTAALNPGYGWHNGQVVHDTTDDFLAQAAFQHANSTYAVLLGATPVPTGPAVSSVSPTTGTGGTGTGGTQVTVKGSGFTVESVVDFGTVPCTDFRVDPNGTTITATAPPGLGIVDIRVTNNFGTSPAVPLGQFAYGGPAPVVVASVGPSEGTALQHVSVYGSGFAPGATVHFGKAEAEPPAVNSAGDLLVKVPVRLPDPEPKTVNVTVTVGVATSPTGPADEFTYEG